MINLDYIGLDDIQKQNLLQVEAYSREVLEYAHRGIPNYPNHGFQHAVGVIETLNNLFRMYEANGVSFSKKERFILYLSCWLHDWGNVKVQSVEERKYHAHYSAQIITKLESYFNFLGDDILECVKYVVAYHSSKTDISNVPKEMAEVRLRLITALLRVADACDISFSRASKILFKILEDCLPDENKPYWIAHQSILNIAFYNSTVIIDVTSEEGAEKLLEEFRNEISEVNTVLLEEGLPKMNIEVREFKSRWEL